MVRHPTLANSHQSTTHLLQVLLRSAALPVCHNLVKDSDIPPGEMPASASTSDVTGVFACQVPTACQDPLSSGNRGKPNAITVLCDYVHAATAMSRCLTTSTGSMRGPFLLTSEQAQCSCSADSKIAPPDEASKEEGLSMSSS